VGRLPHVRSNTANSNVVRNFGKFMTFDPAVPWKPRSICRFSIKASLRRVWPWQTALSLWHYSMRSLPRAFLITLRRKMSSSKRCISLALASEPTKPQTRLKFSTIYGAVFLNGAAEKASACQRQCGCPPSQNARPRRPVRDVRKRGMPAFGAPHLHGARSR
jgi:hypothetical protein